MTYQSIPAYDRITKSIRIQDIKPVSMDYISETIADVTDATDTTYTYYVDMSGYRKSGFQFELDCDAGTVTVTLEGSLRDDGTLPASCPYQDITTDVFGVASLVASAGSLSDMWIDNDEKLACFKYLKIKVVASGTGNTGDWAIYHKRLY